jgi:two-component system, cell cycle sensor histidine kinase and response regulator CckA
MRFLLRRATSVGLFLFGVLGLLVVVELVFGERSPLDIAVAAALVAVASCLLVSLNGTRSSLSNAVSSGEQLRLRLGQQQAVARLGQLALTDISPQKLFDEACRTAAAELHADLAGILELLPDRSAFVLRAGIGWPPEQIGVQQVPAGPRSQGGYTLTSRRPVVMRDAATETRFELSPLMAAQEITSGLTAAIGSNRETYGIIGAHTYEQRNFSKHDVTFLEAVANVLSSGLRRRAAELEAEQARRVLEAVTEGTTDDVFVRDLEGRFIALNVSAAKTIGRPRNELIGRTLYEVMPREPADLLAENDRLVLARGIVETFEETVTLGGETRVFLTKKGPYRAADGTLLGTFGVARDITARKAEEVELARDEERFRLAQQGARMGTWDEDIVGGVTMWSVGLRALYGVGPDEQASFAHFVRLLHPDDRAWVTAGITDSHTRCVDYEFECRIVRPDGEVVWLLARSTLRQNDNGDLVRVLGVAVDVTVRKLAEEELVRSEETLRLALAAAHLGAWDWNVDTGELQWTPGVYEIFGVEPASFEPTYDTMFALIHPDDRSRVEAEIQQVFVSGSSYYEAPCRIVQPSGATRWVIIRATVVRDAGGTAKRMLGIAVDETERRAVDAERSQLETRLRQAEKLEALGQLAGGVAHDFNNLLVAIHGYGALARDKVMNRETGVLDDIDGVLAAAERAAGLTKQLLAFGRRQVLNPEVLDLNEVVRETDTLLQRVIGDDVRLVTTLEEEPVVVEADRGQLEQVITNLAINARDAMPSGGVLTITVTKADLDGAGDGATPRHALLSVTDEGSGIDAATASHMFEPFFTTKGDKGTGLGLATVHGIVAQSGGQVVLDTAVGRGSTFSVYLPLCSAELSVQPVATAAASDDGNERILLVEDDPTVRSIVTRMLLARGYEILDAADGEEAIVRFEARDSPIQLVISDLIMHGLDGRQTIERIRQLEPTMKVLYMSGYTDDAIIRSGGLTPGTGFIQKPFSGEELAARVRSVLDGAAAA